MKTNYEDCRTSGSTISEYENSNKQFRIVNSMLDVLDKYDLIIFDLDGVLWKGEDVIQDTVGVINSLLEQGKTLIFLSNVSTKSRNEIRDKLSSLCNLNIPVENIYTSTYLISRYINECYPTIKNVYLIGSSGLEAELENTGIKVFGGPSNKNIEYIDNFNISQINQLKIEEEIQACVCGFENYFNLFKICYAGEVTTKTKLLFGTNYDTKTRLGNKFCPASYCWISCIEKLTDIEAQIVTKPDPRCMEIIFSEHNIDPSQKSKIIMVGDNLNTDIQFANSNNIDSLLVMTGVTLLEDLQNISIEKMPTFVFSS